MLQMEIYGVVNNSGMANRAIEMLSRLGMGNIKFSARECFDTWLGGLETTPVEGLKEACWCWIRSWGNGGGDFSTESCIQSALAELHSDSPRLLAETIYNSVVNYSKTPMAAGTLTMELMKGCLCDLATPDADASARPGEAPVEKGDAIG